MSDPYGQRPHAGGSSQKDRTWALAAHLGTLATVASGFGFAAPLLVMLVQGDSPFVRRHAVESLNFQISLLIYMVVGSVLAFFGIIATFGLVAFLAFPLAIALIVAVLVVIILATVKAGTGEDYRYPLTIRFIN